MSKIDGNKLLEWADGEIRWYMGQEHYPDGDRLFWAGCRSTMGKVIEKIRDMINEAGDE